MKQYLEDLIQRLNTHEENVKDSSKSISGKAHLEAAALDDASLLPVLKELAETHTAKKYKDYRDKAYFIIPRYKGYVIVKNTDTDEVKMVLNGAVSPIVIKPVKGDSFLSIVVPVRLANEG